MEQSLSGFLFFLLHHSTIFVMVPKRSRMSKDEDDPGPDWEIVPNSQESSDDDFEDVATKLSDLLTSFTQSQHPSLPNLIKNSPDWWKWHVGCRAKEIWLPSNHEKSISSSSKRLKGKSWFKLNNVIETPTSNLYQSVRSSSDVSNSDDTPNSLMKVRLYPTKPQLKLLNKIFGTHRVIYNKLVE